ncbi:PepSY domain-containing protein [Chitiniphilus purpureus]|uniref:PepSY domain-containing protein n=1 Tax=Chitiniphilus purpureus TaxID=2981137 RepID=A0ABY6DH36_9NEIS|nr:PepSY-associated TM helix domain-containing protein [Chitiniphilus sp. CD1]UXY13659.1 PepSY domain-containing protein [Chitiniphilus sp. CD1]
MKPGFRQAMAWLHNWAGLVLGWVMFAIFLTGTLTVFRAEISHWMQPDRQITPASQQQATAAAERYLRQHAADARQWYIYPPSGRETSMLLYWEDADDNWHNVRIDPHRAEPAHQRASLGGDFFYRFHFELHLPYPWGRLLACLAAMVMLVALVSGIVTHRRIFKDFFTFRPAKAPQRAWLDAHNAVGVLALPFHLVITYSGLVTLMMLVMPAALDALYQGDRQAYRSELIGMPPKVAPSGVARPLQPLAPMVAAASRHWQGGPVGTIAVTAPGDANARVRIEQSETMQLRSRGSGVVFDGATGRPLTLLATQQPAALAHDVIFGLHMGRFADYGLRWLYFLCGVAGTLMIGSGLVLWSIKRRQREAKAGTAGFGARLVETLNIATIAGLPLAVAAFFWANRLVPLARPERADEEVLCFFAAWVLSLLHAAIRPARAAWREQLAAVAMLLGTVPLLSLLTVPAHLGNAFARGNTVGAVFELTALAFGAAFAYAAYQAHRAGKRPVPADAATRRRPAATLAQETP